MTALASDVPGLAASLEPLEIDGVVDGYLLEGPASPRSAIEPLAAYAGFDAIISSGGVGFRSKARNISISIDEADLVARTTEGLFEITRAQESELNRELSFSFSNAQKDYAVATVNSRRLECNSQRSGHFEASIATDKSAATRSIDILLQDQWHARERLQMSLMPSQIQLEIGDLIEFAIDGRSRSFQIEQISSGTGLEIAARAIELSVFDHPAPILLEDGVNSVQIAGPPHVQILDLALARSDPPVLQYIAAYADPWTGPLALWRSLDGNSFEFRQQIDYPVIIGETLESFAPGPPGRIDHANVLTVRLEHGALSSLGDIEMLGGRNWMAIGSADAGWEVFAFANAQLVASNTWRLSRLVRGLGGEEHLSRRSIPAGASVVLLDQALYPLITDVNELGLEYIYRMGPADFDHSHESSTQFQAQAARHALKPYAPVKTAAKRTAAGIEVTFLRRGRINADNWELMEIPVGEAASVFEVEIWSGALLKRTISASGSPAQYAAADEIADFGSQQATLDVKIYQLSTIAGRGFPFEGLVPVR